MRRAFAIVCVTAAAALAAGMGEAWAQQMATTTTVVARPDFGQLQAMALDWLQVTVTSSQFIIGAAVGFALAEGGRFLWRWSMRTFGIAQTAVRFVMHHRLIVVAGVAAGYYVVAHRIIA
jgi:hypothetical protein